MNNLDRCATGAVLRAAIWLPFSFAVAVAAGRASAQTTGLPPAVSGDCSISAAGVITCGKTAGTAFAASATTDATNAANISSGNLPVARIATALASPAAIGFTAPNIQRTAADNNTVQNFTQWFTSTGTAGTGTQPGSSNMTPGLNCQGFWTVVSGSTMRATATCFPTTGGMAVWVTTGTSAFGSEVWGSKLTIDSGGNTAASGYVLGIYGAFSGLRSPSPNKTFVDSNGSGGARLWGDGSSTTTYGSAGLHSETSNGTAGAAFDCTGATGTGASAGSCVSTVNLAAPLYTPASSSAACTAGTFWEDANYHYVCTAANTIKRVALAAF